MLTNHANLDAVNIAISTTVNNVFEGLAPATFTDYTEIVPASGTSVQIPVVDGLPTFREWLGSKQYVNLRAYNKSLALRKWEASFALPRHLVDGDVTGALAARLGGLSGRIQGMLEKIVVDSLLANSITCYDGQALLSNSHPNVGTGGTADNLTTSALSFSEFDTADQAIREMADESGTFLGLVPSMLLVGTGQRRMGMEVTGSTRPIGVATTGNIATAAAVAAFGGENYVGGSVALRVTPYLTGNEWFLFALNQPGVKPYLVAQFRAPEVVSLIDKTDMPRFELDEYRWSIEADLSPCPAAWQCAYGSVTA